MAPSRQGIAQLPLLGWRKTFEKLDFASGMYRNRHAIAQQEPVARECGKTCARGNDAQQVQWIASAQ